MGYEKISYLIILMIKRKLKKNLFTQRSLLTFFFEKIINFLNMNLNDALEKIYGNATIYISLILFILSARFIRFHCTLL